MRIWKDKEGNKYSGGYQPLTDPAGKPPQGRKAPGSKKSNPADPRESLKVSAPSRDDKQLEADLSALKELKEYDIFGNQYVYRPFVEKPRTNRVAKALLGKTKNQQISFDEAGEKIRQGEAVTFRMGRFVPGRNLLSDRGQADLGTNAEVASPVELHEFSREAGENLDDSAYSYSHRKMEELRKKHDLDRYQPIDGI